MSADAVSRVERVLADIQQACVHAQRPLHSVQLVAVSKTMTAERIHEVYRAGLRQFGENKVQEYLDKKDELPTDIVWHFIGRLQTNKVRFLIAGALQNQLALLHSLDRSELAVEIEKQGKKAGLKRLPCLVQVNSSGENSKAGFRPDQVESFVRSLENSEIIELKGLMTIGPNTQDLDAVRVSFRIVRELRDALRTKFPQHSWDTLSMGMSADYACAIAEGSTLVRLGSALFGERSTI